jgi:hypothetical protein
MKHRTTAAPMLAVAFFAAVCQFASFGVNLRRRGFSVKETVGAIGLSLIISLTAAFAVITIRRLWLRQRSRRDRLTKAVCPSTSIGSESLAHPRCE